MTNEAHAGKVSPIACDMSAIEPGLRARHVATGGEVFRAVSEIRELADGYAFRLPAEPDTLLKTVEFISLERLCRPFLGFTPAVEPEGGLGGAIDWAGVT